MEEGKKYKVIGMNCGHSARFRLNSMNIREDSEIEILAIQPIGPITIKVNRSEYTLGRGLFNKLILEEIK